MSRLVRFASLVNVVGVFLCFFLLSVFICCCRQPEPMSLFASSLLLIVSILFFCSLFEKGGVGVAVMLMLFRLGRFAGSLAFTPRILLRAACHARSRATWSSARCTTGCRTALSTWPT